MDITTDVDKFIQKFRGSKPIAEMIPIDCHVTEKVVRTKDGKLLIAFEIEGIDATLFDSDRFDQERDRLSSKVYASMSDRNITVYQTQLRRMYQQPSKPKYSTDIANKLVQEYREVIEENTLWKNHHFFFVIYDLKGLLLSKKQTITEEIILAGIDTLNKTASLLLTTLQSYKPRQLGLIDRGNYVSSEIASVYSSILTIDFVDVPVGFHDLAEAMPLPRVIWGFEIGECREADRTLYWSVISIKSYMSSTHALMFQRLSSLPINMNISNSFDFIDPDAALGKMKRVRSRYRSSDDDAVSLMMEMDDAIDSVASGYSTPGNHNCTITVFAPDHKSLETLVSEVHSAVVNSGAKPVREDLALPAQFISQLPARNDMSVRSSLVLSTDFADLAPMHSSPKGQESAHWGDFLMLCKTVNSEPYFFNLHQENSDLGHTLTTGMSGAGKTVFEAMMLMHSLRNDIGVRQIIIDKDASLWTYVLLNGGSYVRVERGRKSGFNPFYMPYDEAYLGFLYELMLATGGGNYGSNEKEILNEAIVDLYRQYPDDPAKRTIKTLWNSLAPELIITEDLKAWVGEGRNSWVFDNTIDELSITDIWGVDVSQILNSAEVKSPIMAYLFERISMQMNGKPLVINIQEFWQMLDDPLIAPKIEDYYRVARKKNVVVMASTQAPEDAMRSSIGNIVVQLSANKIYLANPAGDPKTYNALKMTDAEYETFSKWAVDERLALVKRSNSSVVLDISLAGMNDILFAFSMDDAKREFLEGLENTNGGVMPDDYFQQLKAKFN